MSDASAQDHEASLDSIIDKVLVLSEKPEVDDALIQRLQYDLAIKIHTPEEIARRYGLFDVEELRQYLTMHPQIIEGVKKIRAVFESDTGVEDRMRTKFQFATEELIPTMAQLALNPAIPAAQRIDSFKQLQRGAGMDGLGRDRGAGEGGGQKFVLNILFSGDNRQVSIAGTIPEDPSAIPPPNEPSRSIVDEEPDEEADV